jgi:hypothetical protein
VAGTTSTYGFPYPTASDTPAGHTQMQALAQAVEDRLELLDPGITPVTQIGFEARSTSAQSWGAGGGQKITLSGFNKPVQGNIAWNGTTGTINVSGVYSLYAQARVTGGAAVAQAMHIGGTTYNDATFIIPGSSVAGYGDVHVGGVVWLDAGTQFCVYVYTNNANAIVHATRPAKLNVWKV